MGPADRDTEVRPRGRRRQTAADLARGPVDPNRRRTSVTAIPTFGIMDTGTDAIEMASPIATACRKNSVIETFTIAYDASETPSPRSRRSFMTCGQETS